MKHALVIGGTDGLGAAVSFALHAEGICPIIAGRSALRDDATNRFPADVPRIALDVTDPRTYAALEFMRTLPESPAYVFWVSGVFTRKPFLSMTWHDMDRVIDTNFVGGLKTILAVDGYIPERRPYHLVVVASSSSWRLRTNEAVYCASKAAQAAFTRNFASELSEARPGSQVTLVNPGGIRTKLFGSSQDTTAFMDPAEVAQIIVSNVLVQTADFKEVNIMRYMGGAIPDVTFGAQVPEVLQ